MNISSNQQNSPTVIVASLNPVKLEAVRLGLEASGVSYARISGVDIPSGVSDQPLDEMETLQGATNRAIRARNMYPDATFCIGIEGGIHIHQNHAEAFAWIVINWTGGSGQSRTSSFQLPEKVSKLVMEGTELGHAIDKVFGQTNSKQKGGAVGLLTNNTILRTELYRQSVQLALIPFMNPILFPFSED
jgi:inosine/xanthosine triphosphatase